jgi:hypothetical protein
MLIDTIALKESAMRKLLWVVLLALPFVVAGGLVYAKGQGMTDKSQVSGKGPYVCPLTGEELLCPNCCPLNCK